jgi:hypothetical protein
VAPNSGSARTGTLLIAGQTVSISQATGCVATLSTQAVPETANGGSVTVGVTMSSSACTWTATANNPFINNVAFDGNGSGSVSFSVDANAGVARTGTLTVAGTTVTVTQANGCTFLLNPTGAELQPQGVGPFTFALSASDAACPWTMLGHDSWVSINTSSGTGSATLSYSATANVGPARTSSIDVGGRTFSILQDDGCTATVTPTGELDVSAIAQTTVFHLALSTQTCAWTASSSNSALSVTDTSGTGDSDVHFSVQANTGPERTFQVQLKGGQSVTVRQASGCAVALPSAAGSVFAAGGTANFNVSTASGCGYTATSSDPWISGIAVTAQGVSYNVAATDETKRVGTITVTSTSTASSAVYTVTQASGCVLVLSSSGGSPPAAGGPANFTVQTVAGCSFTATTTDTWLQPVTVSDGTVSYRTTGNQGPARSGTISVTSTDTGVTTVYAVSQTSGCSVALVTQDVSLAKDGGPSSFAVTSGDGCGLNITSPNDWLSGFSSAQGTVSFDAAANTGTNRDGTIVVTTNDTNVSVTLPVHETSGCTVTLPVASAEVGITGGDFGFDVTTGSGCGFKLASSADWLQAPTATATGATFTAEANTGVARTTTITVTSNDSNDSASYVVHQAGPITRPVIGTQPASTHLKVGVALSLEVVASGGDLHYQWRKNGVDIPGATSLEYRVLAATAGDSGSYDVVITNAAGSVTSSVAVVVVSADSGSDGGSDGGAGGAPDTFGGGNAGVAGNAGNAGSDSGNHGSTADQPYVGGGNCSCTIVGGANRDLAGSALGLLFAAALIVRRQKAKRDRAV